jgi:signal transduction histidine kinase
MARQLDELLDVAALEAGRLLDLQRQPTDLVMLARRVATEFQGTTDRHKIRVVADTGRITGEWDPLRLERVLHNLLKNAVKYSPEGIPITVTLSSRDDPLGSWVTLTVDDKGIGIPASDSPRGFRPVPTGEQCRWADRRKWTGGLAGGSAHRGAARRNYRHPRARRATEPP